MKKVKTQVSRSGSWIVFIILLLLFFPAAILYWLFKMRKTKTYTYTDKKK